MVIDIDQHDRHSRRKLLTGSQVEVLSLEENIQGSWHKAIVIDDTDLNRTVKYTNRFLNNCNFIESIPVSYAIDGYLLNYLSQNNPLQNNPSSQISIRNNIRPVPYRKPIEQTNVIFGTCVDVFAKDTYFEGVLIDQNLVLLPDLGNLENVSLSDLSLSLDWDEVSGEWKPRGKWMFLEALEENQHCAELSVPVRQLWYEARSNPNFSSKIAVWHHGTRTEWDSLVSIVMREFRPVQSEEYLDVVSEFVYSYQTKSGTGMTIREKQAAARTYLASIGWLFDVTKGGQKFCISPDGTRYRSFISACEAYISSQLSPPGEKTDTCDAGVSDMARTSSPVPVRVIKGINEESNGPGTQKAAWHPVQLDPEFSSEVQCVGFDKNIDKVKIRKHLLYLGWVVEIKRDRMPRYRYHSPDGNTYYSIKQMNNELIGVQSVSKRENQMQTTPFEPNLNISTQNGEGNLGQNGEDLDLGEDYLIEDLEPENLPQSIQEYIDSAEKRFTSAKEGYVSLPDLRLRAKKHLLFLGWTRCYTTGSKKTRLFYESPAGKLFGSLLTACKACLRGGIQASGTTSSSVLTRDGFQVSGTGTSVPARNGFQVSFTSSSVTTRDEFQASDTSSSVPAQDGFQVSGVSSSVPVKRGNKKRSENKSDRAFQVNEKSEDALFEQLKRNLDGFVSQENSPVTPLETQGLENGNLKKKREKSRASVTKHLESKRRKGL